MPKLNDVVDALGPSIVRPAHAGPDCEVTGLVIYDELVHMPTSATGVLLAVGLRPAGQRWERFAQVAAGFACIAVKAYGLSDEEILPSADATAPRVLVLADEVSWEQLIGLLSSALTYTRASGPGNNSSRLGDLFTLANAVAATVGGATAIADPARRLLAYSTVDGQRIDETRRQSILDLQVPTGPEITSDYQTVHRATGVIELPASGSDLARLAAPIRAGGELLGTMWVIDPGGEHRELARQRLGEAASIAALHLLRERTERDGRQRRRGDLLAALLSATAASTSAASTSAARQLGPPAGPVRVVALGRAESNLVTGPSPAVYQILELVTLHCQGEWGFSAATDLNDTVYVLLNVASDLDQSRQRRLLTGLDAHVRRAYRYRLHIGVGDEVPALAAAADSRRSADRVLQLMRLPSRTRPTDAAAAAVGPDIVFSEDVRAEASLLRVAEGCPVPDAVTDETISAIAEYDQVNHTEYLPTLAVYLREFGDIAAMANSLHVHANTCRYRLVRLKELFDVDLTDPDGRLILALQLRLRALLS